jgi:hypothetical protein
MRHGMSRRVWCYEVVLEEGGEPARVPQPETTRSTMRNRSRSSTLDSDVRGFKLLVQQNHLPQTAMFLQRAKIC